jgi:hypothetical protein
LKIVKLAKRSRSPRAPYLVVAAARDRRLAMFGREMADVFESYAGEASAMGEYVEKDFDALGAEEAVRYFVRAEHILEAYMRAVEEQNVFLYTCLVHFQTGR